MLAALLLIPSVVFADEKKVETQAVEFEEGEKRGETEKGGWVHLLSANTKSLDEHWKTTGNWTLNDGVATLTPREDEQGWSQWSAYLWSRKKYRNFDREIAGRHHF